MRQSTRVRTAVLMGLVLLRLGSLRAQQAKDVPWYVSTAAIHRVTLKPHTQYWRFEHLAMDPGEARRQLLAWKQEGITAVEIFAPEEGGNSYDGLDAKNRFRLDPELGSMADFRRLVELIHSLGMRAVTFQNMGYSSVEGEQFHEAEDVMRRGQTSRETRMFFWSKSKDAPQPEESNSYFFCRPELPGYSPMQNEFWQWSERAQAYYWTRWPGKDEKGGTIHLPQYNWVDSPWPEEAHHVVRFWMATGLDGMILDAVNWYTGATWQKVNDDLTGPIASRGQMLSQPEGGGGFEDEAAGWVQEGRFTNLYDYGLGIWWNKNSRPLIRSVEESKPAVMEAALRAYHDRLVAAGGTLYFPVPKMKNADDQQFVEELIATAGDMACYCNVVGEITAPAEGVDALLKIKAMHPAMFQNSLRRRIATDEDAQVYAFERYAADDSERLLMVFNFSREPLKVAIDLGAMDGTTYVDLVSGQPEAQESKKLNVQLPGHGYRIFAVKDYGSSKKMVSTQHRAAR